VGHPNRTNGAPTPTTPKVFYRPDALPAAQPTQLGNAFPGSRLPGARESRSLSVPEFPAKTGTVQLMALLSFSAVAACARDASSMLD